MRTIDEIVSHNWNGISVTFNTFDKIRNTISRTPSLYAIYTDTPKEVLKKIGKRNDTKHYNLQQKVKASELIPEAFTIKQNNQELYCVYNGHCHNLRQRFVEHFKGTKGTGCLALFEIKELQKYKWRFDFLELNNIEGYSDSKLYRTILEQHLRVKSGWPILCSQ